MRRLGHSIKGRTLVGLLAAWVSMANMTSASAASPGSCHTADLSQQRICDVSAVYQPPPGAVGKHSGAGAAAGQSDGPASGASQSCKEAGKVIPCHMDIFGTFDQASQCYVGELNPQPPYDPNDPIWKGHPAGAGAIYIKTCNLWAMQGNPTLFWSATPPAVVTVTPLQLAQRALRSVVLPKPVAHHSPDQQLPDGRPYTVVRVPTWFWVEPAAFKAKSARAAAGPVWAVVTVTPSSLTFTPGDGGPAVSCTGPGRARTKADGTWGRAPGGCDYTYPRSSLGAPGGMLTGKYTISWDVTWTGSGGSSGAFGTQSTSSTARFAVAEAQAVVTR